MNFPPGEYSILTRLGVSSWKRTLPSTSDPLLLGSFAKLDRRTRLMIIIRKKHHNVRMANDITLPPQSKGLNICVVANHSPPPGWPQCRSSELLNEMV